MNDHDDENTLDPSKILPSVVQYFIAKGENELALALIPTTLRFVRRESGDSFDGVLRCPPESYSVLRPVYDDFGNTDPDSWCRRVQDAIEATLPIRASLYYFNVRLETVTPDPDWREQAERIASGKKVVNQAPDLPRGEILIWHNLRFRAEPERRIAAALDAARVLFLPNCVARLSSGERRMNQEPDFIVCDQGKWGILEIDGTAYHPSAARDHSRDRMFRDYGIRVIERFQATDCMEDAPGVVQRFLRILRQNG